jgi:collagenase-like PrtC family protease
MAMTGANLRLAVGPVLYLWKRERLLEFYAAVAESPADIVYLGETVCAKRRSMRLDDWMEIARMLTGHGKQVVISTLVLLEAESEVAQLARICANGEFLVEANDAAAIDVLHEQGLPFVAGAGLNVYNAQALMWLRQMGLMRWVPPVEMSGEAIGRIVAEVRRDDTKLEVELFAFGRMPLAYSARCFTARAQGLTKDTCEFICDRFPEGLVTETQEGQPLFALNGIQTQSAALLNLLGCWREAQEVGVDILRVSPRPSPRDRTRSRMPSSA